MRIIYLWDADYPWDVRVHKICLSLTEGGHEVRILARNRRWEPDVATVPEGEIHRMKPWRWLGRKLDSWLAFPAFINPRWIRLLDHAVRRWKPDAVIVRDLPLAPTAAWVGTRANVPVILDMAENYPAMIQLIWDTGQSKSFDHLVRNPRIVAAVERWVLPRVSRIWVDVEEQRDRLAGLGVGLPPVDVVRNTPPRDRVGPPPTARARTDGVRLEVVYLGILELQRGIGDLLDAAAILRERGEPIRVVIVGNGRDEALFRRQAAALGLDEGLAEFTGFLPHEKALERVARADVGANPIHRNEKHDTTLPNKLFDYMAAGLPVLTSDSTPSARVVKANECGEVFRSGDPADLAEAVRRMFPRERRLAMGLRGQAAIATDFNWGEDEKRVLRSLQQLAETDGEHAG
ncbi:MAG: glycosyltransferase family 4 protein [Gemmatimonadota bacterium]